jgi:hypothetical protein
MPGERYRITSPTLAVILEQGWQVASAILKGVPLLASTSLCGRVIDIIGEAEEIVMFSLDFSARAKKFA